MPKYTKQQLEQQYEKLPDVLKDAIFSVEIAEKMFAIGKKHGLTMEKTGFAAEETGFVILGLLPPREFASSLASRLAIDTDKATALASDINHQVFFPLREALKDAHQIEVGEAAIRSEDVLPRRPAAPAATPTPAPAPVSGAGEMPPARTPQSASSQPATMPKPPAPALSPQTPPVSAVPAPAQKIMPPSQPVSVPVLSKPITPPTPPIPKPAIPAPASIPLKPASASSVEPMSKKTGLVKSALSAILGKTTPAASSYATQNPRPWREILPATPPAQDATKSPIATTPDKMQSAQPPQIQKPEAPKTKSPTIDLRKKITADLEKEIAPLVGGMSPFSSSEFLTREETEKLVAEKLAEQKPLTSVKNQEAVITNGIPKESVGAAPPVSQPQPNPMASAPVAPPPAPSSATPPVQAPEPIKLTPLTSPPIPPASAENPPLGTAKVPPLDLRNAPKPPPGKKYDGFDPYKEPVA